MKSWTEGLLSLLILAVIGGALFLFGGGTFGGTTDTTPEVSFDAEAAARGETLAQSSGCLACHTVDGTEGTVAAPTFKGVAGSQRPLTTGEFVLADDAYLFNSITNPTSQVVLGYDPLMPADFGEKLTGEQVNDLVEYIKSLAA